MLDFLNYFGNKVVGRYKTVESNIRNRSNSFYDSFLDFARGTDGTKIIKAKGERIPSLLLYYLLKDAKLPNIGFARYYIYLREYPVLVPPYELCMKFTNKLQILEEKFKNNVEESYKLTELYDFILPLLISGRIKLNN